MSGEHVLLELSRRVMELYQISYESGHVFDDKPFAVLLNLIYQSYVSPSHENKGEFLSRYPILDLIDDVYNEVVAGYYEEVPHEVTGIMHRICLLGVLINYI